MEDALTPFRKLPSHIHLEFLVEEPRNLGILNLLVDWHWLESFSTLANTIEAFRP